MSNVLRLAIVDPNDDSRDSLKSMLLGMDMVWLEAECSRYEFFADVVGQTHPDIGVVSIDHDATKALDLISDLKERSPECSILVISGSTDGQIILKAMRSGAKEFLTQPVRMEDLITAIQRIGRQGHSSGDGRSRSSTVLAIAGATGGVGTTSLAVNIGCALAKRPENSVALIDLDLALGDADVFLDTIPDYTLVDVAQNIARLDFNLLKRSLTKHASGLYLLPRPIQLQDTALVTPDDLHRVIGLLKATFSHLIFDLSKGYSELDMVAMQAAEHILLVTQLDLPCLRNVVRLLMSMDEIDGLKDKIRVVVNRVGLENGQISMKKARETIGREIFKQIPNDYRVMAEVRNNGVPLVEGAPRAGLTQAIIELADMLCGGDETSVEVAAAPGATNWLNFWPALAKARGKA
ncbi:MAG: response regulator [Planctomycetaceae bacterium]|nr:response regulator [Planctomycetales bacterium]MCB9937292.1 response regulator [Planctomycetaceae bacterium]